MLAEGTTPGFSRVDPLVAAILQSLARKRLPPAKDVPPYLTPENDLVYRPTPQQLGIPSYPLSDPGVGAVGPLISALLAQRPRVSPQMRSIADQLGGLRLGTH